MFEIELSVFSEIDRLQQVVIHKPGREVDLMVPDLMGELLFDDILSGDLARSEHDQFRQVLELVADEVLDIQDLFIETLAEDAVRHAFLEDFRRLANLPEESCRFLQELPARELAQSVISGLTWEGAQPHRHWQERSLDFRLKPIPNLLFMRDPAAVVGHGYNVSFMATWAREREALILSYVFRHHPRLRHMKESDRFYDQITPLLDGRLKVPQSLEGGDTLVLSDKVLAVGCSERSSTDGIYMLAERLRQAHLEGTSSFETLLMVLMPKIRSAMHLDTIFTRINQDECLVYPPFFSDQSGEMLNVVQFDLRHRHLHSCMQPDFLNVLKGQGIDLKPIYCGGPDPVLQQREQWTDGANAFAMAPGVILLYGRNLATVEELSNAGYRISGAREVIHTPGINLLDGGKHAILLDGAELSRARGGPRCMTMPLARQTS